MMPPVNPVIKTTQASPDFREWLPTTFDNALSEIDHLVKACQQQFTVPLFRGQVRADWLLDAKLVRSLLVREYGAVLPYPRPIWFHTKVTDTLIAKFSLQCQPSAEALAKEITDGIDPDYELMKYFQQYGEKDVEPLGTFLVDWTIDHDIALYFSTYEGVGSSRHLRLSDAALWVLNPVATGKVLMTEKARNVISKMKEDRFRLHAENTLPLIFHPIKQTAMLRAMPQRPVYIAQMDYRYDLADLWTSRDGGGSEFVFTKIILSQEMLPDVVKYLEKHGIDEGRVFPDLSCLSGYKSNNIN